uniref:Uncharacterized protein n=2 Tax=Amphimedon queenslandica TaxID=400682 RepID=A0A1X7SD90_AMPQE
MPVPSRSGNWNENNPNPLTRNNWRASLVPAAAVIPAPIVAARPILLVFGTAVMVDRDSWGHSYSVVRGEILGFAEDERLRKHLPRMFSLIKNESWGFEDDQIPS